MNIEVKKSWKSRALSAMFVLSMFLAMPGLAGPNDKPVAPGPRPVTAAVPVTGQSANAEAATDKSRARRYDRAPLLWEPLRHSLALTREYLERPPADPEKRLSMIKAISAYNKLIKKDEKESEHLIHYIVGSAFNNPEALRFFNDLEAVQKQLRDNSSAEATDFKTRTHFDDMMGEIGQNADTNPSRFNYFLLAAATENTISEKWAGQFEKVATHSQVYDEKYQKKMRWYRRGSNLASLISTSLGVLAAHNLLPIFPLDIQLLIGGAAGLKAGRGPLRDRILSFGDNRIRPSLKEDQDKIIDGFGVLLEIDPERTAPYLISNILEGSRNASAKPLADMSFATLLKTAGPEADKALITLGLFFLRQGDGERARVVFGEMQKRDPKGYYGQLYPKLKEAIDSLQSTNGHFAAASKSAGWKKAAIISIPALTAVWAAVHMMGPEELSAAVVVIRDLAIGEMTFHVASKALGQLTNGNVDAQMKAAEAKLYETFKKIPEMGEPGMDILHALAENKLPGNIGIAIAEAAVKAIRDAEGFASAHEAARTGETKFNRGDSKAFVLAVTAQLERERKVRVELCRLDFGKIAAK